MGVSSPIFRNTTTKTKASGSSFPWPHVITRLLYTGSGETKHALVAPPSAFKVNATLRDYHKLTYNDGWPPTTIEKLSL